jgi:leucyl-tRNA synthetase
MPQWAGSCWYYLRFTDPANGKALADRKAIDYWAPVDLYVGGAEHAVLHLLYARFWHKVLFDLGLVATPEPFMALRNQGMILGENGEKMSKSRGNVVNPDDVIREYGADTLRLYEMFLGPLEAEKPWKTQGIQGPFRFLERAWRLLEKEIADGVPVPEELDRIRHKTVRFVGERIDKLEFNTAISQLMIFLNELVKADRLDKGLVKDFVRLLHPFAPFITEEMWERLGGKPPVLSEKWPSFDPAKTADDTVNMVVQVNGKLRDTIPVPRSIAKEEMEKLALASEKVRQKLEGQAVVRVVVVPGKLVNIVVRPS